MAKPIETLSPADEAIFRTATLKSLQGAAEDPDRIGAEYLPESLPVDYIVLTDQTDSTLEDGAYAEDYLKRLRRHDNATVGGILANKPRYTGLKVVDYDGEGGSGSGSTILLDQLQALFSGGVVNGDIVEISGTTTFQLDPADLPNVTPAFQGFMFVSSATAVPTVDFWDLSGSTAGNVYQDVRHWSLRWAYTAGAWVLQTPSCFGLQQTTAASGGTASTKSDGLTSAIGISPVPDGATVGASSLVSAYLYFVMIDSGTPFTSGTARITWDLEINAIQ